MIDLDIESKKTNIVLAVLMFSQSIILYLPLRSFLLVLLIPLLLLVCGFVPSFLKNNAFFNFNFSQVDHEPNFWPFFLVSFSI